MFLCFVFSEYLVRYLVSNFLTGDVDYDSVGKYLFEINPIIPRKVSEPRHLLNIPPVNSHAGTNDNGPQDYRSPSRTRRRRNRKLVKLDKPNANQTTRTQDAYSKSESLERWRPY